MTKVAEHAIRSLDEQQTFLTDGQRSFCAGINDLHCDAGNRMADRPGFVADLPFGAVDYVRKIHGNHGGEFCAAVTLEQIEAVVVFEVFGNLFAQLFRAGNRVAQRGKLFARAASHVAGVKRRRADQQRGSILLHGIANGLGVHGVRVVDGAKPGDQREPEGNAKTEGVKKRQDAHNSVAGSDRNNLANAFDVGDDIVVGKHDTLGRSRAATGKDDRRKAIGFLILDVVTLQVPARNQKRRERGQNFFA